MSVERAMFLSAMRQVASTVTVVTTKGPGGTVGATVSAFSSLSADPPSVLVCLRSDSRISRAVAQNRVFCVNVLPEGAANLALRFAGTFDEDQPDRFEGLELSLTPTGPILPQSLAFSCTLVREIPQGGHMICIGDVTDILHSGKKPLTYMQGDFHVVRPHEDS